MSIEPIARTRTFLLAWALLITAGCETVEVPEPLPPEYEPPLVEKPTVEKDPVEAPKSSIIVRIHPTSLDRLPGGAFALVTLERLEGTEESHSMEFDPTARLVQFDDIPLGPYQLTATATSGGVEIGRFSYPVTVGNEVGDVTVQIDYLFSDLLVESVVSTSLDRDYSGAAAIGSAACVGSPEPIARSDLRIATDGESMQLAIKNFQGATMELNGGITTLPPAFSATGTFESSDDAQGTWTMSHLAAPSPQSISAVIDFQNETADCTAQFEYAGLGEELRSDRPGANTASANVEVVGNGETLTATLGREGWSHVFEGIVVGTYDVFVNVQGDGRAAASHQQSVEVGSDGATVAASFDLEWALAEAAPLSADASNDALSHSFTGKSIVTEGAPECIGSIPLVDSATLAYSATEDGVQLIFDNFYGRVLHLTGSVGDGGEDGAFSASGAYESSDAKTGSWSISHVAAPTPRTIAMLAKFQNDTDSCQATYEFAGVR